MSFLKSFFKKLFKNPKEDKEPTPCIYFECDPQYKPYEYNENIPYVIKFYPDSLTVSCNCLGFLDSGFCSHIDATLLAGERFMVPPEDWEIADYVMDKMEDRISTPSTWKASWKKNLVWRGLEFPERPFATRFERAYLEDIIPLTVEFECKSRSQEGHYHTIKADAEDETATCSCDCFKERGFCAHLDATFVEGETAMIHRIHENEARHIIRYMAGMIQPPIKWKTSWKRNLKWRGRGEKNPPVVCFYGKDQDNPKLKREDFMKNAEEKGFATYKSFSRFADIVVMEISPRYQDKIDAFEADNFPVLTYREWDNFTIAGENIPD
ncbi:SWIM zinc finger family protein [Zymomonas mobilis]|uniref:SWIM zinc finger family protein n=1 Tax=Zymomonas mobilis TaxID=542 RepID=UPI0021C45749|nr:SWIM zinc finger family protein [Zymomonas mobilis]MCP9308684.1 SWIM zinc finger family protein [Zymomonas mobilis]